MCVLVLLHIYNLFLSLLAKKSMLDNPSQPDP